MRVINGRFSENGMYLNNAGQFISKKDQITKVVSNGSLIQVTAGPIYIQFDCNCVVENGCGELYCPGSMTIDGNDYTVHAKSDDDGEWRLDSPDLPWFWCQMGDSEVEVDLAPDKNVVVLVDAPDIDAWMGA